MINSTINKISLLYLEMLSKILKINIHILTQLLCYDPGWHRNLLTSSRVNKLICQPGRKHQEDIFTPQPPD